MSICSPEIGKALGCHISHTDSIIRARGEAGVRGKG